MAVSCGRYPALLVQIISFAFVGDGYRSTDMAVLDGSDVGNGCPVPERFLPG